MVYVHTLEYRVVAGYEEGLQRPYPKEKHSKVFLARITENHKHIEKNLYITSESDDNIIVEDFQAARWGSACCRISGQMVTRLTWGSLCIRLKKELHVDILPISSIAPPTCMSGKVQEGPQCRVEIRAVHVNVSPISWNPENPFPFWSFFQTSLVVSHFPGIIGEESSSVVPNTQAFTTTCKKYTRRQRTTPLYTHPGM